MPAERRLIELGWEDSLQTDAGWRTESWLVRSPDASAASRFGQSGGAFQVVAGREMAWTLTTNPIWISDFPWLEVVYGVPAGQAEILLSDDSTGPITPGALNMENPLASGGQTRFALPAGADRLVVDIRPTFKPDRVARISLLAKAGDQPARLTVRQIRFWASDPRQEPGSGRLAEGGSPGGGRLARQPGPATRPAQGALLKLDAPTTQPAGSHWTPVVLSGHNFISADWLARALDRASDWPAGGVTISGIPFYLDSRDGAAAATGVMETENIEIDGQWQGSELALLLGVRAFGGSSWPGAARAARPITSPHELKVTLEYQGSERESAFLWSPLRRAWSVEGPPQPYIVALQPGKVLTRLVLEDNMNFGQVFLLAAAANRGQPSGSAPSLPPAPVPERRERAIRRPRIPATAVMEGSLLSVESDTLRLTIDLSSGFVLTQLRLKPLKRHLLTAPSPLLELSDEQGRPVPLSLADCSIGHQKLEATADLAWVAKGIGTLRVQLRAHDNGPLEFTPTLQSDSDKPVRCSLACRLGPCRIADRPEDRWYLLGTRSTLLDNVPVKLERPYSGEFPLQIMDIFNPREGGLGLIVGDRNMTPKTFRFEQTAADTRWTVVYPRLELPPHGSLTLPPATLMAHEGDWHATFERYRHELRGSAPKPSGRMGGLFYCRRDYPLGGTGYLFDPVSKAYTPQRLIDETVRGLGGLDMIDISGWAYHEATGRVGDYLNNDLGGLPQLAKGITESHQAGTRVGLYFEGYLIDRRAPIAAKALPAWQLVDKSGKPRWWSGEMEFFTCPGVAEWQKELSSQIATAARESGADAVYVDEFGFCGPDKACWSPHHGHPVPSNPMLEETRMLAAIRKALDEATPKVGIYIEQIPCDAMMPLVDAAFNYGMAERVPQHPTKLPLHRYLYPELASVEMLSAGIRPIAVGPDDLHRCIFHGLAVWMKGRCDSWYSPAFRETARRAFRILREYAAVFASPDCDPLVPTLAGDIYANRFRTPQATIITLYNARFTSYTGPLLRTTLPADCTVRDLWNNHPVEILREGTAGTVAVIIGHLDPRSVGVFLIAHQ